MADGPLNFSSMFKDDTATGVTPATPTQPQNLNFSSLFNQPQAKQTTNTTGVPSGTPSAASVPSFGSMFGNPSQTGSETEHDESDRFTQEDPNANWIEKAWTFANKPLTESLFGWGQYRQGAGGIERFAERTLSGITSPLSLVTLAAFAPAGIAEGVAGSALKEGLVEGADFLGGEALDAVAAASKVENYAKAVDAAQKAKIAGGSIESAAEQYMPYQEFINYGQYLRNLGMKETDMLGESFMRRGVSQGLAKAGVGPAQALRVAKGVETLVNTGFSVQAVHGAMYAYPRALDMLENGDYDGATEAILEAGTNTLFGSLGLAHSIHSVGDLVPAINEKNNLPLTQEVQNLQKMFGVNEGALAKTQFDIEARRKDHVAELFELAGLPQYAEAFKKIPENQKYDWGKELKQAFDNILVNKDHREALAQKQMEFFAALDSGMKSDLASQKISALVEAYKLQEFAKANNLPMDVREPRTIQTIANEESNNLLLSKAQMNEAMGKIRAHELELKNLSEIINDEDTTPQEREIAQKQISTVNDMLTEQKMLLPQLHEEFNRNANWDKAKQRFEVYQGWIKKIQDEVRKDPENAPLAAEAQKRIEALRNRIGRRFERLYKEKYDDLNTKLDEAAKDINPVAPYDRNALEEFNKKVRIMGVNPQDIKTIEEAFPQFRSKVEEKISPEINPHEELINALAEAKKHLDTFTQKDIEQNTPEYEDAVQRYSNIEDKLKVIPEKEPGKQVNENDPDWRKKFPLEGGQGYSSGFGIPSWLNQPLHPALPDNLEEMVEKAKNRVHTPEQLEYVQKYIKALSRVARKDFSDREMQFYKSLRKADDDNWDVGYNNGIIHSIVDDHIHHIWGEDPRKGYTVNQRAGSGAFAINASQARHRSWTTAFEGILQGRRLAVHDPTSIIAHDANNIAVAASHRKLLESLFDSGMKAPDGMPLGTFLGMGLEVRGEDGSKARNLVNPNIVRKIEMSEGEIERLKQAGLLDRYLKDGLVVDRTAKVDQSNVQAWIDSTKKKMEELEKKNPLLTDPKARKQHEAGWGQLELFAKEQAGKIATYLNDALNQAQSTGAPVSEGNKAAYGRFNMAASHNNVLHGLTGRTKLLPADFQRLDEYRQRNENFSQGLNGKGTGPMTPADVARFVMQEKEHLDPELTSYVKEFHDWFAPRDEKGNIINPDKWDRKTMSTALYHIAHAALNKEYPQLIQDMDDLNYVDKNLTSVNPITREMHKDEALKRLEDINARQPKKFLWAPKGYITIDHPAFRDWKWMATDPNGVPTLASSEFAVHPEIYDYLVNRMGLERSALREAKGLGLVTAPLLKVGAKAKYAILSGSPFHVIQEALRAAMLWTNPFVRPNPVENINELVDTPRGKLPLLALGIENSLNIFNNRFMKEDASVGVAQGLHSATLEKVPVVKQWLRWSDQVHHFLFDRYIPALKSSGFKKMFNRYAEAHPDWSNDAVAYAAAQHVNNAFGGINWREMGRSSTTQDWFHLVALAPDWLESEMRFASQLFNNWGIGASRYNPDSGRNFTREQVVGMAAAMWSAARVLNLLYSGNAHFETPFGLATKDKDGREIEFSLRTMPTDILHMASDPMGFLNGRMSPVLREEEEIRTGRNQFGQKLTPGEKMVDMISNVFPIPAQQNLKKLTGLSTAADVPIAAQIAKGAGATAYVYRTPAEKTAANLAAERSEEGSMSPAKVARHRLLLQLEDDLRSGRIKTNDLEQMVSYGNLPIADAKAIVKNVQETAGEDSETARLYSRVSRLDFQGAVAVWDDANPSEKKVLEKLIRKKAAAYLKKSITDFTPDERAKDPIFKRARQIAPLLETTPAS